MTSYRTQQGAACFMAIASIVLMPSAVSGDTLSVPGQYPTIQAAIDASVDGDVVEIADGIYSGEGNIDIDFHGKAITVRSASGNPNHCEIDCENGGRAFHFHSNEEADSKIEGIKISNGYGVVAGGGILCDSSSPTFRHCIFFRCSAFSQGGGLANQNGSDPLIEDCVFLQNYAVDGGGIFNEQSSPVLVRCSIQSNNAEVSGLGGGMYNHYYSSPDLVDCLVYSNSANVGGGVANTLGSSPTLTRCVFHGNQADTAPFSDPGKGGGIANSIFSSPALYQCIIASNTSDSDAAGVHNDNQCDPVFVNCQFLRNQAGQNAGAVLNNNSNPTFSHCTFADNDSGFSNNSGGILNNGSNPVISNCILWGNSGDEIVNDYNSTPVVSFCSIQNGVGESWFGPGCIDANPVFVNPDGPDNDPETWQDNDYRLAAGSPCIDSGDNTLVPDDLQDVDDDGITDEPLPCDARDRLRFIDDPETQDTGNGTAPIVDMGALEYQLPGDVQNDGVVDYNDFVLFVEYLSGPDMLTPPTGIDPWIFVYADLDGDGDVDLSDYMAFVQLL